MLVYEDRGPQYRDPEVPGVLGGPGGPGGPRILTPTRLLTKLRHDGMAIIVLRQANLQPSNRVF